MGFQNTVFLYIFSVYFAIFQVCGQFWILYGHEAPRPMVGPTEEELNVYFDLTATYRLDSDIPAPGT